MRFLTSTDSIDDLSGFSRTGCNIPTPDREDVYISNIGYNHNTYILDENFKLNKKKKKRKQKRNKRK